MLHIWHWNVLYAWNIKERSAIFILFFYYLYKYGLHLTAWPRLRSNYYDGDSFAHSWCFERYTRNAAIRGIAIWGWVDDCVPEITTERLTDSNNSRYCVRHYGDVDAVVMFMASGTLSPLRQYNLTSFTSVSLRFQAYIVSLVHRKKNILSSCALELTSL